VLKIVAWRGGEQALIFDPRHPWLRLSAPSRSKPEIGAFALGVITGLQ